MIIYKIKLLLFPYLDLRRNNSLVSDYLSNKIPFVSLFRSTSNQVIGEWSFLKLIAFSTEIHGRDELTGIGVDE